MPTFNNQQPALTLNESLGLFGVFPSFGGGGGSGMTMAMFHTYAFNNNPGGAATASGQLLPINQNQALFALLGTNFGGNGQTTFQLPNLSGRQLEGVSNGIGTQSGSPTSVLSPANFPTTIGGPQQPLSEDGPALEARYFIATQGIFPPRESGGASLNFLGSIVKAAYDSTPGGYAACEGQLLSIASNTALFSILGTTYGGDGRTTFALPDLRGRTLIGTGTDNQSGTTYDLGQVVGEDAVTITNANLPTNMGGQGIAINNIEPSLAVNFFIYPSGIFPNFGGGGSPDSETPFVGEIIAFAGNFTPGDGIPCDGRLLAISEYDALFALIGTTYGGDGQDTFAVPDLRGRSIVGIGPNNLIGETVGTATLSLTSADFGNLDYAGTDAAGIHYGGDGNDRIDARGAGDQVFGGKGNDYLIGGAGGDAINGGDGSDTADYRSNATVNINVNLLNNTASGGDADGDTLTLIENLVGSDTRRDVLVGNNSANTIVGSGGADSIRGEDGNDILDGGAGADGLNGGGGMDTVTYANSAAGVTVNLDLVTQVSAGDAAGDVLNFIENITGSALADTITGNALNNTILGGAGDDIINGGGGSDLIEGGIGADTIDASGGVDTISYAGSALGVTVLLTQILQAGVGDENGDSLTGVESLIGSGQGDTLVGNGFNNRLDGGAGGDTIEGGLGIDNLIGGAGADIFRFLQQDANVDYILDWQDGVDDIQLSTGLAANFGALGFTDNGTSRVVVSGLAGGGTIVVKATAGFTLDVNDFVFV